jgi:hypothetical protein
MCNGCGRVPRPQRPMPSPKRADPGVASRREAERTVCPRCGGMMKRQPGGSLVCKPCGATRA